MSSRSRRQRRKNRLDKRVQVAETDVATFTLQGRYVTMQGANDTEAHRLFINRLIESESVIHHELDNKTQQLRTLMETFGPCRITAMAGTTYLRIDPNTYKEWQDDRSPAHIEYLALQALGLASVPEQDDIDAAEAFKAALDALSLVRELFQGAQQLLVIDALKQRQEDPDNLVTDHTLRAKLESLGVRGAAYHKHAVEVTKACLAPFSGDCERLLGFTVQQALDVVHAIGPVIGDQYGPLEEQSRTGLRTMVQELKRARRGRSNSISFPEHLLRSDFKSAEAHLMALMLAWTFLSFEDSLTVDAQRLSAYSGVPEGPCQSILEAFSADPEEFVLERHRLPVGAHPLTERPLLRCGEAFLCPVQSSLIEAIRPRMEDLLQRDSKTWERYIKARGLYLEKESVRLLSGALPGSKSWSGLKWSSPNTNSDLDGLVNVDDMTLRVQSKAGRVSASARRGAPARMRKDLKTSIESATRQHDSLANELQTFSPVELGFTSAQASGLSAPMQVEVITCLDDMTVWSTESNNLRGLGLFPAGREIPWVVSLTDLMVITEMLHGPYLAQYILRRMRVESDGRIATHDELDWLGYYISEGLHFDDFFAENEGLTQFRLLSYTDQFDAWYFYESGARTVPVDKPRQNAPNRIRVLLERLEREQPEHWIIASLCVLDGDDAAREALARMMEQCDQLVRRKGWSNASVGYSNSLGVSLWVNKHLSSEDAKIAAGHYFREKMEQHGRGAWVGIVEGGGSDYTVVVEENDEGTGVAALLRATA